MEFKKFQDFYNRNCCICIIHYRILCLFCSELSSQHNLRYLNGALSFVYNYLIRDSTGIIMAGRKKGISRNFTDILTLQNPIQKANENQDNLNEAAMFFENQVQVVNEIKIFQIKPKKNGPNKQLKQSVHVKHNLSDLYRRQKHRALQEIILGETLHCPISADKVEKHYEKILSSEPECNIVALPESLWKNNMPSNKQKSANFSLTKKFTPNEVKSKLLSKIYNPLNASRSVGLDRISFRDLRSADSDCSVMTVLFNACLKLQTVPKIWMEFYSVLVNLKNNDLDSDAKNTDMTGENLYNFQSWRPITMERTVSKLFQSLIAARLIVWAKNTERLSATQKGFLMLNAACESSFILQECKNYAEDKERDLAVAWLDFTGAADHLPQSAVLHALNKHSVPAAIIKIVQNMLDFSNTKFRVMGDFPFTKNINILKGLPQGSPISPILLDLVMEPILRDLLNAVNDTFEIYNNKINHYAIPNELTLITDSPSKLQNLLRLVEKNAKLIGLRFNIDKCLTYHYDGKRKEVKSDSRYLFFEQRLSTLPKAKMEEFFGVKQGLSIGQEGCPTIKEMIKSIKAIDMSSLKFYQKVESVLIYIIPRVENYLRGLQSTETVSLGKEDKINESLQNADEVLRDRFKCWLSLPSDANTRSIVFQVAAIKQSVKEDMTKLIRNFKSLSMKEDVTKAAKYNYLPFMDLFYIMKVVHGLKMLTSQDEVVKKVAFATLMAEVDSLIPNKKKMKIEKLHLAQYLSGELYTIKKISKSIWSIVREATLNLKVKIPLKWEYNSSGMQLSINFDNTKRISILNRKTVNTSEEKLKNALVEYYIDETMKNSSGPEDNIKAIR